MTGESQEQSHDRRSMFRFGLKKLMEPLAVYIQDRLDVAVPVQRSVLRPPGALPEEEFLARCYRCGNCIDVCPARAIKSSMSQDVDRVGTPYIDADLAACVVCDELACMKACPSGALKRVESVSQIEMGLARVEPSLCERSRGQPCTRCVDKCPIGKGAIGIGELGEVVVVPRGCVGCGTCQFYCPVTPRAIEVDPI